MAIQTNPEPPRQGVVRMRTIGQNGGSSPEGGRYCGALSYW